MMSMTMVAMDMAIHVAVSVAVLCSVVAVTAMMHCAAMMPPVVAHAVVMSTTMVDAVTASVGSGFRRERHQQRGHDGRYECKAPQQGILSFSICRRVM